MEVALHTRTRRPKGLQRFAKHGDVTITARTSDSEEILYSSADWSANGSAFVAALHQLAASGGDLIIDIQFRALPGQRLAVGAKELDHMAGGENVRLRVEHPYDPSKMRTVGFGACLLEVSDVPVMVSSTHAEIPFAETAQVLKLIITPGCSILVGFKNEA